MQVFALDNCNCAPVEPKQLYNANTCISIAIHNSKVFSGGNLSRNDNNRHLLVQFLGVDIPEVDCVLQFDPPSNAEAFVHRCGRTARSGHKGQAVVFLLPTEKSYVEFIALNQKVELKEMSVTDFSQDLPNLLSILRDWQKNDRSIFDMANRAFVSHIQSYSKHECKYILRLKG